MQTINLRRNVPHDPAAWLTGAAVILIAVALVALPPLLGAALVVGSIGAVVILARPRWGFYLLLLSIPVQDIGAQGEATLTNALFGLTLLAWLLHRAVFGGERLPHAAVGPLFAIFVCGLALSLTVAQDIAPGISALFQWVKALIVYFMALDFLRTRRQVVGALIALVLAGSGEALIGLAQFGSGAGPASFAIGDDNSRAYGTFGRPNSYAGYLEMILPIALIFGWWVWQQRDRNGSPFRRLLSLMALGGAALIGLAVLASFSRGAWLGTAGGLGLMIVLASRRSRGVAIGTVVAVGLVALLGGYAVLPQNIRDRATSILGNADSPDVRTAYITAENFAVVERLAHWWAGIRMFQSNLLLGVGLGNFNVRFAEFTISPTFLVSQGHAHNYYIHVAAEAGLVGLTTYLLLLFVLIGTGLRALRQLSQPGRDPFARALVIAVLGTITAVAIHNIFENLHVLSMGIQLSTAWALLTIVTQSAWDGMARRGVGDEAA
jgi:O-antigen ligase